MHFSHFRLHSNLLYNYSVVIKQEIKIQELFFGKSNFLVLALVLPISVKYLLT